MKNFKISKLNELIDELRRGNGESFLKIYDMCKPIFLRELIKCGYSENELYIYYNPLLDACLDDNEKNILFAIYHIAKRQLVKFIKETEKLNIGNTADCTILDIKAFIKKYRNLYNEQPTITEIASSLNIDEKKVESILTVREISIDSMSKASCKELNTISFISPTMEDDFCEQKYKEEIYNSFRNHVKGYEEEFKVLEMWVAGKSLEEIGNMYGFTREAIRRKILKITNRINRTEFSKSYRNPEYVRKLT